MDPRIGVWNPSLGELPGLCETQSRAFLRVAALAPALGFAAFEVRALGEDLSRVELTLENRGYLPTQFLASATKLTFNEPLYVDCATVGGARLLDEGQRHVVVGHLEGWGRGLGNGANSPGYQRSRGNGHRARVVYLVRGHGTFRVRAGSCRVGYIERELAI